MLTELSAKLEELVSGAVPNGDLSHAHPSAASLRRLAAHLFDVEFVEKHNVAPVRLLLSLSSLFCSLLLISLFRDTAVLCGSDRIALISSSLFALLYSRAVRLLLLLLFCATEYTNECMSVPIVASTNLNADMTASDSRLPTANALAATVIID